MKRTRKFASAVFLAAFVAAACSNTPDKPRPVAASPTAVPSPAPPVSTVPVRAEPTDPKETGVVVGAATRSFADGEAAFHARSYAEALAIFEDYVRRRPHNAWGHYMLALSAWKVGDPARSEQAFEQALRLDPRHIKSHVNLSRVLVDQKRHDEAIEWLTQAAEIDPESLEVQRLLGRTYHALGRTDEAVQAYGRAIALNDRDAWSLNYLGSVFVETNRSSEALPLLIQAVELRKDVAEFHNNLGLALEQSGHLSAAATAYGSALRIDPGYEMARQNLARVDPQE